MKILIIESSKVQQNIIQNVVSEFNPECYLSSTVEDALTTIKNIDFDLILVSYILEDGDALSFTKTAKSFPTLKQIPIIMLTSEKDPNLKRDALMCGITEVITKSELVELKKLIRKYLSDYFIESLHATILLIEDSKTYANIILNWFNDSKYKIKHFTNASDALNFLLDNEVDLIITDIILEGDVSGYGLLRSVRELTDDKKKHTPILVMTGFDDVARRIEIYKAGANDYVQKPIIKEEFLARVSNLIQTKLLKDKIEKQNTMLRDLSIKDPLTGAYNRRFMMELLPTIFNDAKNQDKSIGIIICDIDYFKKINDTYGHLVGDIILKSVAGLLSANLSQSDYLIRYGGEEFIIILLNQNISSIYDFCENLRIQIEELRPENIPITCSFGVVTSRICNSCDMESLINMADTALYTAKNNGRNRVETYHFS